MTESSDAALTGLTAPGCYHALEITARGRAFAGCAAAEIDSAASADISEALDEFVAGFRCEYPADAVCVAAKHACQQSLRWIGAFKPIMFRILEAKSC